jgi:hypothetical protein
VPITTTKKKIRMNLFPRLMASFAPIHPPIALQAAIGNAIAHIIFPFNKNKQMEPKLVARLTILALAEACRKSNPIMAMKANRVGRGITPPPSHTTVHALAHGGFFRLLNLS